MWPFCQVNVPTFTVSEFSILHSSCGSTDCLLTAHRWWLPFSAHWTVLTSRFAILQLSCFTSAKCLHCSSLLQCTTEFSHSLQLNHILCVSVTFYLFTGGHLGCFRLLAIVDSAAVNLCNADTWRYFCMFTQKAIRQLLIMLIKEDIRVLFLGFFGRGFIGFSIEIALFYNPASSLVSFFFLMILEFTTCEYISLVLTVSLTMVLLSIF